jgi:hypothetical protein
MSLEDNLFVMVAIEPLTLLLLHPTVTFSMVCGVVLVVSYFAFSTILLILLQ